MADNNVEIDLSDLLENPSEALDLELKRWLALDELTVRAKLARHIAALANHGGGYIVFGFNDDGSRDTNRPSSLEEYNHDTFSAIIKKYLTPVFQCQVSTVNAKGGDQYPIVRIPGHGSAPIAAKKNGPLDAKQRPQGICAGKYYIRKPGPESAPIESAEEWSPIIRRCVLNDRDRLLGDIASLVRAPIKQASTTHSRLVLWHKQGKERFRKSLEEAKKLDWPVSILQNHCQFCYLISKDDDDVIPEGSLLKVLDEVNNEVRDTVWTGWSMFYPFSREEIAPAYHPEHNDGTGINVLEANLMGDGEFDTSLPDFWRVTTDGRATISRPYREDRIRTVDALGRAAGTWMSPETIVRETAELVTHARQFAKRFDTTATVAFRCSWIGLKNRELMDFDRAIYWSPGRIAKANQGTAEGEWTNVQLAADWASVVAELACPILRLFGYIDCNPEMVERMAPRFIKL